MFEYIHYNRSLHRDGRIVYIKEGVNVNITQAKNLATEHYILSRILKKISNSKGNQFSTIQKNNTYHQRGYNWRARYKLLIVLYGHVLEKENQRVKSLHLQKPSQPTANYKCNYYFDYLDWQTIFCYDIKLPLSLDGSK